MSFEALVLKFVWAPLSALFAGAFSYLLWLIKKDKTKLDNTYTKSETSELIELSISSVKTEFDLRHRSLENKLDSLLELVKADISKNNDLRENNTQLLNNINLDLQVLRVEVENIKSDVGDLKQDVKSIQQHQHNH